MKFPKALIDSAVDNIDIQVNHFNQFENCVLWTPHTDFHTSEYGYIANVKLFIKKIAKYLDAAIVSLDDNNPIILKKDGAFIEIIYDWDRDHDLWMRVAVADSVERLVR